MCGVRMSKHDLPMTIRTKARVVKCATDLLLPNPKKDRWIAIA